MIYVGLTLLSFNLLFITLFEIKVAFIIGMEDKSLLNYDFLKLVLNYIMLMPLQYGKYS